ncbi:MAG: homocysteine S-methyltransferase family protein, partial [Pseudomonadota bacterium]
PGQQMSANEAEDYHALQVKTFSETQADMITALTLNYVEEAIGLTRAAMAFNMPVVISFTVETDGKLPTGQSLSDAIDEVESKTQGAPTYYKINCAHPTHFLDILAADEPWLSKIRSIRANASCLSHAELDEAEELDEGDPVELAIFYKDMMKRLPNLNVLGGCCGTDLKHIEQISKACFS